MKQTFEIDLPIKIGDKVWLSDNKGFGSCNFLERYTQYSEYTVTNVQVEFNMKTKDSRIVFSVDGKDCSYIYNDKIAFTKEQLYESFREEIEKLNESTGRLNDFIANVSHEIRTPINTIQGICSMEIGEETDPEKKEKLVSKQKLQDFLFRLRILVVLVMLIILYLAMTGYH